MIKRYQTKTRKIRAVFYDGILQPVKRLLGIDDATYDQHERTFFVPEDKMVTGNQGVLNKGQYIFESEEGSGKFIIADRHIFDTFYELDEDQNFDDDKAPDFEPAKPE